MTAPPGYTAVFDIHDRLPDIVLGWIALATLGALIAILAVPETRGPLLRRWWLVAVSAAPLAIAEALHAHEWLGALWAIGFITIGFLNEWHGGRFRLNSGIGGGELPRGSIGLLAPSAVLVMSAFFGLSQLPAIGLGQSLEAGHATILAGRVERYVEVAPAGKNDCFTVDDRRFCVSNWNLTNGRFRDTRFSGTPLAEGLTVRLFVIGDDIVRIEAGPAAGS